MSTSQRQPHGRQTSTASDDWAPATIVSNFDDDSSNAQQGQASDPSSLPDWDQWQDFTTSSAAGPSNSNNKSSSSGLTPSLNQADDDFFAALERSTPGEAPAAATAAAAAAAGGGEGLLMPTMATPPIPHPRPPSPPEIDLEQRRIEERDRQLRASGIVGGGGSATKTGAGGSDDDWFAKFERDLKSGRGRSGSQPRPELGSDQLESMREAHASPLPTPLRAKQSGNGHASGDDYFSQATTAAATRLPPPPSSKQPQAQPQPPPGNNSWWGSIRHLGSDWAHRAADYLDPGVDFSDEELKLARKMGAIDLDSRSATPVGGAGAAGGKGTPSRGGSRSSSVAPAPAPARGSEQQRKGSASSTSTTTSHAPAPPPAKLVSGAPGVDFSSLNPRWNAGNWTLPSDDPSSSSSRSRMASAERLATASPTSSGAARKLKPLPVTLTGRREDSSPVVTDGHAAHIQPHLPPRLKLGRTWRLCYSSDQHGISLETLYSRVGRCMDSKPGANGDGEEGRNGSSSSSAANRQDGWLRGASSATRAALGGDDFSSSSRASSSSSSAAPPRLGSGLTSMRDAGLILAVRDEQDNVFGAFLNERLTRAHRGYYGNGECFLFRQVRAKGGGDGGEEVRVYGATARNNFYALGETGYLAFGGSSAQYQAERAAKAKGAAAAAAAHSSSSRSTASSGYGLWLDSDFSHGVTARCETFENVPLAQSGEEPDRAALRRVEAAEKGGGGEEGDDERWEKEIKFEPVIVEVWAVGLD